MVGSRVLFEHGRLIRLENGNMQFQAEFGNFRIHLGNLAQKDDIRHLAAHKDVRGP